MIVYLVVWVKVAVSMIVLEESVLKCLIANGGISLIGRDVSHSINYTFATDWG